jgi:predicted ATPase
MADTYAKGRYVQLNDIDGMNIYSYLDLMDKLRVNNNGVLDESNLSDSDRRLFSSIYNSGPFFKFLHNSKMTAEDVLHFMKNAAVIARIRAFLAKKGTSQSLIIRMKNQQSPYFQRRKPGKFLDNEILLLSLLEHLGLIETEIRANKISIERFSSGEQSLIRVFSFFADIPLPDKAQRLIVFFDEPENSLHPKWQQQFPFYFKKIVEEVYQIKGSHFIFATHSPLIVMRTSGEPNMNVLRFYRDAKGRFASEAVEDIKKFSIEEVLLDEFLMQYREKSREIQIVDLLKDRKDNLEDPINAITYYSELKRKIDDLHNNLRGNQ